MNTGLAASAAAPIRGFPDLSSEQAELGRLELAKHIGVEEASTVGWLRRLGARRGEWFLAVKVVNSGAPGYEAKPWHHFGPRISLAYHPLGDAIELIRGGAEKEAERIEKISADNAAALAQANAELAAAEKRQREQRAAEEKDIRERAERFDERAWLALPPHSQMLYTLALLFQEEGFPDLPAKLRALGEGARRSHATMPFPGVEWRK